MLSDVTLPVLREIPKSTGKRIHVSGLVALPLLQKEAGLVTEEKVMKKEDKHFLDKFLICFNNDASEAKLVTFSLKSRKVNYQIH